MGPKKLNLNVTYKNQSKPFICEQHEIAKVISSYFKINLNDVTMYAVNKNKKYPVTPKDIVDMMRIEIVPNRNGQKTIQAGMEASKKMVENMVSKLRQNTSLTGQERKVLIDALETHSTAILTKRKLDQTDIVRPLAVCKKVQVNIPADNKESFCQTDPLDIPSEIENPISDEDPKQTLKRLCSLENPPKKQIEELMHKTYADRRNFITVQCPPVLVIREHYPALFCVEQVKNELDRIFYPGKCKEFLDNMAIYTKHILHYKESKIDDILEITEKARSHARTPKQKAYAEVVGSIFVLTKLLDEDFGFIHLHDHRLFGQDMALYLAKAGVIYRKQSFFAYKCDFLALEKPILEKEDAYPYIDASNYKLQDTFSDEIPYHIIVEGQHLCATSTLCEAVLCLVASFFIFQIAYPKSCRHSFIAFEKLYLVANETHEMDDYTRELIQFYKEKAFPAKKKVVT